MEHHPLLDAVNHLAGLERIMIKDIEETLNVSLSIKENLTTEFFIFYEEKKEHPWKSTSLRAVELRTLTDKAATHGMILSMTIADEVFLDRPTVIRIFGFPSVVEAPPHGTPGTFVTYVYQTPEGVLKFDVAPKPVERVVAITIERME